MPFVVTLPEGHIFKRDIYINPTEDISVIVVWAAEWSLIKNKEHKM